MASDRIQRQIDRLLDQIEEALSQRQWPAVRDSAQDVLALDPENTDAQAFLAAAERALGSESGPITSEEEPAAPRESAPRREENLVGTTTTSTPFPVPQIPPEDRPASFADGRYQVKKFLGEGAKKKVYLAHDIILDRDVAFALIKTEIQPQNRETGHIFISHVEEDSTIAIQIASTLEAEGYRTWYYERDSVPGPAYLTQMGDAIDQSQAVVLIISAQAVGSNQVTTEVVRAHEANKAFIPLLNDISHVEFQARAPVWRQALGASTAIAVSEELVGEVTVRIMQGLQALGVRSGRGGSEEDRTRVIREAQAMGRLGSHPHIVGVFDLGEHEGQPYLVTELMEGGDVEGVIENAPNQRIPLEQAVTIAKEVCRGLEFAHASGIVHRDLKPSNVWMTSVGTVKIGDFGLAVAANRSRLTQEGMMVGTVSYMPPEQAMGGEVTPRADLYSLGALLYEMVTGRPPFLGDDSVAIIGQHINTPPVAPTWHNQRCPRPLEALILRLLAKDPAERPASATDVLAALESIDLSVTEEREPASDGTRALDSLAGGVFVGRHQEMGELKASLEDALSGQGRLVMLVGEPGIGKTRTAQELTTYAGLRGAQVLWGRCYEEQGMPPYWPWVQAIRSYVRERDVERLRSELGAGAGDIAEIVSDVRERLPNLKPSQALGSPEQARFRLFDSISAFLKTASQRQPLVLVLDDLQWADQPSLLLLQFLVRELVGVRLLVVGIYRDMELSRQHPLAEALGELTRERLFQRVLLRGLTQDDVARFIEVATGIAPPPGLAAAVHTQTEGNPLFVTEIVRLLVQEGELTRERASRSASWSIRIPEGVREVIGRRLNRLSQRCNETLTIASVIGREFELRQLAPLVADTSEDQLLDVLEEATAVRVIEEMPQAVGRYQFTHALIQETLAGELSTARRARLHQRIGQVLEEVYGPRLEPRLAELAYHFWEGAQAGDLGKAAEYTTRAAERAMGMVAYEEAVSYYKMALQALELQGTEDGPQHCDLLLALGEAQRKVGSYPQALATFQQAADVARKLGSAEQLTLASLGFEDVNWRPGLPGEPAVKMLEEALASLEDQDSNLRAKALGGLARALAFAGFSERAEALGQQAIEMARRIGDRQTLGFNLRTCLFTLQSRPERIRDRLSLMTEVLQLGRENGDLELALEGYSGRILDLLQLGDINALDDAIEGLAKLAEEVRQPHYLYLLATWRAMRALLDGRFEEVENLAQQAMALGQRLQSDGVAGTFGLQMFSLRKEQGRLQELEPVVRAFLAQNSVGSAWRQGLALIYKELDREEEARVEFEHLAANDFTDIPQDALWLTSMAYLSEVCSFLKDASRADSLYRLLLPYSGHTATVGAAAACFGAVDRYLGLLAAAMSRWDEAEQHFNDALELNSRMGARPYLAHTQQQYADMLLARGRPADSEKAASLLNDALATSRELEMSSLMGRVLARQDVLTE